jgi:site-specific DNA-methyltransferase (cytosine-N4-specific)
VNHLQPWYQDDHVTLLLGDAADILAQLPAASVDCVVTSPPYYRVPDYGHPGQIGNESTPRSYVERLCNVFQQVHRVLRDDGTCRLNLADTYATGSGPRRCVAPGMPALPAKNLLGLPWRTALALQDDGWILRNEIIWHKPNTIPESARNRLTRRHEHLFLLTKQPTYAFDLDPIRQPYTGDRTLSRRAHHSANKPNTARGTCPCPGPSLPPAGHQHTAAHPRGRNPETVWTIATRPSRHAHTAAHPIDLPLRCIAAGSRPGALVLDPFSGSGTTVEAAVRLGRRALAIDLRQDFHRPALARLRRASGDL